MQTERFIPTIFSKWTMKNNIVTFMWGISLFTSFTVNLFEIAITGLEDIYLQTQSVWNPNKEYT